MAGRSIDHLFSQDSSFLQWLVLIRSLVAGFDRPMTAKETIKAGRGPLPYAQRLVQRITQRSVKFIRWIRIHLFSRARWDHACASLAQIYASP